MENKAARYVNIALGAWLFLSTFLWIHSDAQYTNSWLVGLATVIVAAVSLSTPAARFFNTALGAWLFISAWALPSISDGTVWNHALVGLAVVVASLIPSRGESAVIRREQRPATAHR
ncbi:MAG: SPW repeat protein [Myxococcales bacterium]|nr:SPW repeat protein [Myxococcales bacterium]